MSKHRSLLSCLQAKRGDGDVLAKTCQGAGTTGKAEGLASPATLVDLTRLRIEPYTVLSDACIVCGGAAQHAG